MSSIFFSSLGKVRGEKSGLKGNVASLIENRRQEKEGSPQLVDQSGWKATLPLDVDKLPSLALGRGEGQLGANRYMCIEGILQGIYSPGYDQIEKRS